MAINQQSLVGDLFLSHSFQLQLNLIVKTEQFNRI